MGTAVIGGMLAATLLAIFLIPVTYYMVERLSGRGRREAAAIPISEDVPVNESLHSGKGAGPI